MAEKMTQKTKLESIKTGFKKTVSKTRDTIKAKTGWINKNPKAVRYGSVGLAILGVLLIVYPFIPELLLRINPPDKTEVPYGVEDPSILGVERAGTDRIPEENRLVIPSIGVDSEILEGSNLNVLNRNEGVWHEPNTGDPFQGGNMVISGHRFQYMPPNMVTFYHLNKVSVEDIIIVYWEGKEFDYKVTEVLTVEPSQVEIRNSTRGKTEVTIYTCTPLWSNSHRLVVKADLIEREAENLVNM